MGGVYAGVYAGESGEEHARACGGGREWIVRSAAAAMPSSCWGRYRRVAVVEVAPGARPAIVSSRSRGVIAIRATWERRHVGRRASGRCAYLRAVAEACDLAERLAAEAGGVS